VPTRTRHSTSVTAGVALLATSRDAVTRLRWTSGEITSYASVARSARSVLWLDHNEVAGWPVEAELRNVMHSPKPTAAHVPGGITDSAASTGLEAMRGAPRASGIAASTPSKATTSSPESTSVEMAHCDDVLPTAVGGARSRRSDRPTGRRVAAAAPARCRQTNRATGAAARTKGIARAAPAGRRRLGEEESGAQPERLRAEHSRAR